MYTIYHLSKHNIIITILITTILSSVESTEFTHDRKRISSLDRVEQNCMQKFKVSENTIIRTQDSKVLGATFLNETETGNREDCFTLCCNSKLCNVAIFEEKSPFSCYLFDCGSKEEFRCKFTSHTYYTSAVLTLNRHQMDLGQWSSQHQHEEELTNLRSPLYDSQLRSAMEDAQPKGQRENEPPAPKQDSMFQAITTHPPHLKTTSSVLSGDTTPNIHAERRCSRFQFECHSGECIAIYNACDGIAQCKDGSDESNEMGCPNDPGDDRAIFNHRSNILEYNNRYHNGASADPNREDGLGYGGHGRGPGLYDYNQRTMQNRYPQGNDGPPLYHQDYPDYGGVNSNHQHLQQIPSNQQSIIPQMQKSKLVQQQPQLYQTRLENNQGQKSWKNQAQPYVNTYQNSQQLQQIPQQILPQQQLQQQQPASIGQNMNSNTNMLKNPVRGDQKQFNGFLNSQSQKATDVKAHFQPQNQAAPTTITHLVPIIPEKQNAPDSPQNPSANRNLTQAVESKTNNTDLEAQPSVESKTPSPSVTLRTKDKATKVDEPAAPAHASLSRLEVDLKELQMEADEQSKQTSGAVLALSLGVCITALLMILVGCRLRGMKRRMRRPRGGRSPLEHDSDYLVNGMYL